MKFIKKLFVFLLVVVGLVLVVAIFLPSKKHIEDSMVINVPAEMIFKQVNNLSLWDAWSPFYEEDTNMKSTYEGPAEGVGCIQKWTSDVHGNGSMEIVESTPGEFVKMKLSFQDQGSSYSYWKFEPEDTGTKVTWAIDVEGLGWPMGRIFGLFMTGMMHKSFQKGLTNLKNLSENQYNNMTGKIEVQTYEPWMALAIMDSSSCDKITEVMGRIFGDIQKYMAENKIEMAGPPYALYHQWDQKTNFFVIEAGIPVRVKVQGRNDIRLVEYQAGRAATASHFGNYDLMHYSYQKIEKYISDNKLEQNGPPREVYVTDPEAEKDFSKWETRIYYPVK
jgi:effector-binding domain-containing protein